MAESESNHPHLQLEREQPAPEKRSRRGFRPGAPPDDPRSHGATLHRSLQTAREATASDLGGYDDRRLIKLALAEKVPPEAIEKVSSGLEVVSQEAGELVLAFAREEQLDAFEARLADLAQVGRISYKNIVYALRGFDRWTPEDRTGWALKRDGFPDRAPFIIDIELWPCARRDEAERQWAAFESWVMERDGRVVDKVQKPHLTIYRLRCERPLADDLLRHRDVRSVDLPPRIGLEQALLITDIQQLEETPPPPDDAPGIAVLDTGIVAGHPLLAPAIGDTQSFLAGAGADDEHGHGTFVSGIALYDDVAACLRNRRFVPELRLFSGRILDEQNQGDPRLIENQVEEAVRYFVEEYGCRVFNLSYGDRNKPYRGRHVAGLALTLDALSREFDVLFVVPTGNIDDRDGPNDWRAEYPHYLTRESAALLDPAPALNALTVGSVARHDRYQPWPDDPAYRSVARVDQPSPFTRHGPSVNGAIKPDLVDYGGNGAIAVRAGSRQLQKRQGVGELSTSLRFASGRLFAENSGTSFAAPRVAHAAARVFTTLPNASVDLCRALLVAHARPPDWADLFSNDAEALRNIAGYGLLDRSALYRSLDDCVTLWAEGSIENRRHHFYQVPIPAQFWSSGMRVRELTVALAYRSPVRTTRIDYRAVSLSFKLVQAASLDQLARAFDAAVDKNTAPSVQERDRNRRFSETTRSRGTVQASTWTFKRSSPELRKDPWFVVVTRNDPPWGETLASEREPYGLTAVLSDRKAQQPHLLAEPRLYAAIQERLRARARARATE